MAVPRPSDPDEIVELLRLAAAGETAALARVIRLRHEALTRLAVVVTLDRDLAATAVHEAWPVAWRELRGGTTPEDPERWLAQLALDEARFFAEQGATRAEPGATRAEPGATRAEPDAGRHAEPDAGRHAEPDAGRHAEPDAGGHARGDAPGALPGPLASLPIADRLRLARVLASTWLGGEAAPGARPAGSTEPTGPAGPFRRLLRAREAGRSARLAARPDLAGVGQWAAGIAVRPVNADESARRAEAELGLERGRRVSVAVSAVIGVLVAAAPYLLPMLAGR